jgi:hypothetical protein
MTMSTSTFSRVSASTRRASIAVMVAGLAVALSPWTAGPAVAQSGLSPENLVGVWQGVERTGPVAVGGRLVMFANGTYERHHVLGALQTWDRGTYQLAQNWVHFNVQDYQPKEYNRAPMPPPPSETWMVNAFDGRTVEGRIGTATIFRYEKAN